MRYYFIYKTYNEVGEIVKMGFSRRYTDKDEMWENLEFQRMCGFECRPFVEDVY